jgi:hypothetical protein
VSTTASPVTHVALTAVNSATPGLADPTPARITGSMSSRAPTPHRTAKDTVIVRVGEREAMPACWEWDRAMTSEEPAARVAVGCGALPPRRNRPPSNCARARSMRRRGSLGERRGAMSRGYSLTAVTCPMGGRQRVVRGGGRATVGS